MADNNCKSSTFIEIPSEQIDKAEEIVVRVCESFNEDPDSGSAGFNWEFYKDNKDVGILVYSEIFFEPEHAEILMSALVEELDLSGIVVCSWAYTCSKMRPDQFGGGAFAVQKGRHTLWIDAAAEIERQALLLSFSPEQ